MFFSLSMLAKAIDSKLLTRLATVSTFSQKKILSIRGLIDKPFPSNVPNTPSEPNAPTW
jgi:hypothetical protein